ncbi:phenylalanyl-trna synthetase subunit beta [Plasmopara halstedii]|uniref:Phenylalanyl-trna synthetase subunit beta n=1 Tax=Plasmopara halstedii TaxID=4781 RepID=A0A0P1AZ87_PLAHL|nr:phenylalanyl-trna synthetase subunit beta [Plasmopara halstedii]CEG47132.1 phenylalanyl-trna synthetase subunit beta [Plasmopara halstedii]|eukprot:XP_024583501.1 phenylalanyl-trna synthetase subunit beta [Plasmopara halstedii]
MLLSTQFHTHPCRSLVYGIFKHLTARNLSTNAAAEVTPVATVQKKEETTWHTLVVGEIVNFCTHPHADRLKICNVNVGDKNNLLPIICGASNVRQGALVPVAKVGTRLAIKGPSGQLKNVKIKKSKLRGEFSLGMICSKAELGLADESDGILILESDAKVAINSDRRSQFLVQRSSRRSSV